MQFYDLFKSLIDYIPGELGFLKRFIYAVLPYVMMACALFTSFFGLTCAIWWCAVTFFFIGSTISAQYLLPEFQVNDANFYIMFALCLTVGVLCAYFSKYLARGQLLISNFLLISAALPSYMDYLGKAPSYIVSMLFAAAFTFLCIRYKYIIIIATTAFSGSFIFWNVACDTFPLPIKYKTLFALLTGTVALVVQCLMNKKALRDTYKDVKKKLQKTEKGGKKAVDYIDKKVEHITDDVIMPKVIHLEEEHHAHKLKPMAAKVILWDLDNTLLDFNAAERQSLKKSFAHFSLGECTEALIADYSAINNDYWQRLERGELTKSEVLEGRFVEFLTKHDLDASLAPQLNEYYENGIADTIEYIENSYDIVQSLQGKVKQYAVTNGSYEVQRKRLQDSGFAALFDDVFISDKVGYDKPSVRYFRYVLSHILPCRTDEILIVGDSLTSDMLGGNHIGIKCCWYNPHRLHKNKKVHIDYEIHSLNEIYHIIKENEYEN